VIGYLQAICEGIQTNLQTIPGLQAFGYLPDSFSDPAAIVSVMDVQYQMSMNDSMTGQVDIIVNVLVARTDARSAQLKLQKFMSPNGSGSIREAIESDATLGGIVSNTTVISVFRGPAISVGGGPTIYLTLEFTVAVYP
jgi:hypothetical protein